jgi:glycosyltransferase involved in cell wall biosynthesis
MIAVAQLVCARTPGARFVLIGDGVLRSRVEALIEEKGLQHHVRLAGWRRDVHRAMKCFDLLLLTSRWEGLPRVMLEAASVGVPIVATRVGGVEEAVVQRDRVRVCEAGDVAALAAEVDALLSLRLTGALEADCNRSMLPVEFHIEEMVKQYQSLYDRLLSQPRDKLVTRSLSPASS